MLVRLFRSPAAFLLALGALVTLPATGRAASAFHLRLKRSEPAANDTVAVAPRIIRLWFTETPQMAITKVALANASGEAVPLGAVSYEKGSENPIEAPVKAPLAAGRYRVTWRSASGDGHAQTGEFDFVVDPTHKTR